MLSGLVDNLQPAGAASCMLIGLTCTLQPRMQSEQWSQLSSLVPTGIILWAVANTAQPAVAAAFSDVTQRHSDVLCVGSLASLTCMLSDLATSLQSQRCCWSVCPSMLLKASSNLYARARSQLACILRQQGRCDMLGHGSTAPLLNSLQLE